MKHVFISYKSEDQDEAIDIRNHLHADGIEAWIDEKGIRLSKSWPDEIDNAIDNSYAMLVLVTPNSVENRSDYICYEIGYALGQKVDVIPVIIHEFTDDLSIVQSRVHRRIADSQAAKIYLGPSKWDELVDHLKETRRKKSRSEAAQRAIDAAQLDHDDLSRQEAVKSLAGLDDKHDAIEAFAYLVKEGNYREVKKLAAHLLFILDQTDKRATSGLLLSVTDDRDKECTRAAEELGEIGDPEAVDVLLEQLQIEPEHSRKSSSAQRAIINALRKIGDPKAVPGLWEARKQSRLKGEEVFMAYVEAMTNLDHRDSIHALAHELKAPGLEWHLKPIVIKALEQKPHPEAAIPALKTVITNRDYPYDMKNIAISILEKLATPEAIEVLVAGLDYSDPKLSAEAREALCRIGEKTVPIIAKCLKSGLTHIRPEAGNVLRRIGSPEAQEILRTLL